MRLFCLLILLAVVCAVVGFATQNQQEITMTFFGYNVTSSVAGVIGATYLLGMFSGWTVIGLLRRSFERVTDFDEHRQRAAAR